MASTDYLAFLPADAEALIFTEQQMADYARDGFIVVDNFFTEAEAKELVRMAVELEDAPEERGGIWKYWNMQKPVDGQPQAKFLDRVECFTDKHTGWANLFESANSKLVKGVAQLFGPEAGGAKLWKEKMNFKKPGSSGFEPHQDAQAGWCENGQSLHISVGVNVDATTIENGCLEMVRGAHKNGLIGPVRGNIEQEVVDSLKWEHFPSPSTSALFFDSFVPHRSEPNRTMKDRRVCLSTYSKACEDHVYPRSKYFEDKVKTAPPQIYMENGKDYRGYLI